MICVALTVSDSTPSSKGWLSFGSVSPGYYMGFVLHKGDSGKRGTHPKLVSALQLPR